MSTQEKLAAKLHEAFPNVPIYVEDERYPPDYIVKSHREIKQLRELVEVLTERVYTLEDEVARLYREK